MQWPQNVFSEDVQCSLFRSHMFNYKKNAKFGDLWIKIRSIFVMIFFQGRGDGQYLRQYLPLHYLTIYAYFVFFNEAIFNIRISILPIGIRDQKYSASSCRYFKRTPVTTTKMKCR